MGLFSKKTEEIDYSKLTFLNEYLIVGTSFECKKNPRKTRKSVLRHMKIGDSVIIEKYYYQGKPAYMIVDPKTRLDLGVLSAGAAAWVSNKYPDIIFVAYLSDKFRDSFHIKLYENNL